MYTQHKVGPEHHVHAAHSSRPKQQSSRGRPAGLKSSQSSGFNAPRFNEIKTSESNLALGDLDRRDSPPEISMQAWFSSKHTKFKNKYIIL